MIKVEIKKMTYAETNYGSGTFKGCNNFLREEKLMGKKFFYATTPLVWLRNKTRSLTAAFGTPQTCPFLWNLDYP